MPIYEYQCEPCGHSLEALQKLSDALLVECPACFKPTLKKKISAAGFRLSGSGWYETDFKSGSKKNLAGDSATSAPEKSTTEKTSMEKSSPSVAPKSAAASST